MKKIKKTLKDSGSFRGIPGDQGKVESDLLLDKSKGRYDQITVCSADLPIKASDIKSKLGRPIKDHSDKKAFLDHYNISIKLLRHNLKRGVKHPHPGIQEQIDDILDTGNSIPEYLKPFLLGNGYLIVPKDEVLGEHMNNIELKSKLNAIRGGLNLIGWDCTHPFAIVQQFIDDFFRAGGDMPDDLMRSCREKGYRGIYPESQEAIKANHHDYAIKVMSGKEFKEKQQNERDMIIKALEEMSMSIQNVRDELTKIKEALFGDTTPKQPEDPRQKALELAQKMYYNDLEARSTLYPGLNFAQQKMAAYVLNGLDPNTLDFLPSYSWEERTFIADEPLLAAVMTLRAASRKMSQEIKKPSFWAKLRRKIRQFIDDPYYIHVGVSAHGQTKAFIKGELDKEMTKDFPVPDVPLAKGYSIINGTPEQKKKEPTPYYVNDGSDHSQCPDCDDEMPGLGPDDDIDNQISDEVDEMFEMDSLRVKLNKVESESLPDNNEYGPAAENMRKAREDKSHKDALKDFEGKLEYDSADRIIYHHPSSKDEEKLKALDPKIVKIIRGTDDDRDVAIMSDGTFRPVPKMSQTKIKKLFRFLGALSGLTPANKIKHALDVKLPEYDSADRLLFPPPNAADITGKKPE